MKVMKSIQAPKHPDGVYTPIALLPNGTAPARVKFPLSEGYQKSVLMLLVAPLVLAFRHYIVIPPPLSVPKNFLALCAPKLPSLWPARCAEHDATIKIRCARLLEKDSAPF